ncbi:rhamnogalacturonan lyase family protein, partial [Mycobacterium tuberculosis]
AYIESEQGGNYLSWRILVDEYAKVSDGKNITFEIFRDGVKVATVENKTNYLDLGGEAGDNYQIKAIQDGAASHSQVVEAMENNYLSLNLQRPLPSYSATGNFAMYRLNDLSVADVDGDGEYEIAVKWYPGNGFDPGISGTNRMSSPHIIDVYKLDGTALWRLNMGYSSPA